MASDLSPPESSAADATPDGAEVTAEQTAEPTLAPVPKLADDVKRGMRSILFTIIGAVPATILINTFSVDSWVADTAIIYFVLWTIMATAISVLAIVVFRRATGPELAVWLRATTPRTRRERVIWLINGGGAVPWAVAGSGAAITSVILVAVMPELRDNLLVVILAVAVVVTSVFMIIVAYAVRYAREDAVAGGIQMPGAEHPVFADYLYMAVQVATTFSTSDVVVTTTAMRRLVATNSLVSFTFNSVIVALLVSVLLGAAV